MILVPPEKIRFDCVNDLVDYTVKGMMPRKKDFDRVIEHIIIPDGGPREPGDVYIGAEILPANEEARKVLVDVLERVYVDRAKNRRNMIIIALASAALTATFITAFHKDHENDTDDAKYLSDTSCAGNEVSCA